MAKALDDEHALGHLHRLTGKAGVIITVALWAVALLCGAVTYSALVKETFEALVSGSSLVWKFTIVTYFTSWVIGVKIDKDRERDVYKTAPREGQLDLQSTLLAIIVFVLFGLMYLVEDMATGASEAFIAKGLEHLTDKAGYESMIRFLNEHGRQILVILIHALWIFNIPLWLYFIKHFVRPISEASLQICLKRHDYAGIARIKIMDAYLAGEWQKLRFAAGLAYLGLLDLVFFAWLGRLDDGMVYVSLLICGFVIVMEGWVWLMRFKVKFALECVHDIAAQYRLTRRTRAGA